MSTNAAPNIQNNSKSTPSIPDTAIIDKVFVDKSARVLQLLIGDTVIKSYHIALGGNPIGHKQQQGDKRTPSGSYTLDYKNEKSKFYRSIHISYPNASDKTHA
ncbi:L,D-transpeptidase family protein, partial [Psychrobacter sp. TB55-MNA-CIBAN-0194]|uniref:L,D-transpeptidase family protein n=1 Tax=Psychrobacter sp. TB55-MNA-CIBAN-0194 TaxID=3140445 RepID=UPI0033200955